MVEDSSVHKAGPGEIGGEFLEGSWLRCPSLSPLWTPGAQRQSHNHELSKAWDRNCFV